MQQQMKIRSAATAAILFAAASATSVYGQAETWNGNGADNKWTTNGNWLDNSAPVASLPNQGYRFSAAGTTNLVSDMNGNYAFGQVQFQNVSGSVINSSTGSTMSLSGFNNGQFIANAAGITGTINTAVLLDAQNTTNTAGEANRRTIDTNTGTTILNGTLTANANVGRNFDVRKIGAGTLELNAANNMSATYEATNGATRLGNDLALGTATIVVANGAANTVRYTSSNATARTLANAWTLSGAGVLAFGQASGETGSGDITLNGAISLADNTNTTKTIAVLAGGTTTINGVISGVNAASGIQKNNPGTLILNAINTYTGTTVVGNGTLRLNGRVNGAASVGGGVLEGTGTVGGGQLAVFDVDLNDALAGGAIAPGTNGTIGQLKGFTASFGTGGGYLFDIAGASSDLLLLTGNLTAAATSANPFAITVSGTGFNNNANQSWTLVDGATAVVGFDPTKFTLDTSAFAPGATGTFSLGLADGNTNLVLNYAAVPEPATLAAFVGLAGLTLARRRRAC